MMETNMVEIGIKMVRDSGITNMCSRKDVQFNANKFGLFELVVALEGMKARDYFDLITCIEYDALPKDLWDPDYLEYSDSLSIRESLDYTLRDCIDNGEIKIVRFEKKAG